MFSENFQGLDTKVRPARLFRDKKSYSFYVYDDQKKKYVKIKIPRKYQASDTLAQEYVGKKIGYKPSPQSNVGKVRPGLDTTDISDYKNEEDVDLKFIGSPEEKIILKKRVAKRNKETEDKKRTEELLQKQTEELKGAKDELKKIPADIGAILRIPKAPPLNIAPPLPPLPTLPITGQVNVPIDPADVIPEEEFQRVVDIPLSPRIQAEENKRVTELLQKIQDNQKKQEAEEELDKLYEKLVIPGTKTFKKVLRGRPNNVMYEREGKGEDQFLKLNDNYVDVFGKKFKDLDPVERKNREEELNKYNMTDDRRKKVGDKIKTLEAAGVKSAKGYKLPAPIKKVGRGDEDSSPGKLPALWSDEINQFFVNEPLFGGVVASDQIKDFTDWRPPFGIVMNKDKSHEEGSHWVALYFTPDSIEYFDPLGDQPDKHVLLQMKNLVYDKWKWPTLFKLKTNEIAQQHGNSQTCGYHAIRFLVDRFQGLPYDFTTRYNNSKNREKEIKSQFKYI